jgi:hypothetical protein
MRKLGFAIAVLGALSGLAGVAFAQDGCHDLRALNSQTLTIDPLGNGGWGLLPGATTGILDGQELSPNYIEYIPGKAAYPNAVAGRYWEYTQVWHFNDKNGRETGTLTVTDYHASFPVPTGKAGMGTYTGTGKITSGTGLFLGATGTVHESGPYLFWFSEDGWMFGKYNATYVVRVCTN